MILRAFVIALAAVAALVPASAVKDKWIGVRTPHLNIVSNAGEGATRVMVFRNDALRTAPRC